MSQKILFYFIFVVACSKDTLSLEKRIFPDDLELFSYTKRREIVDSIKHNFDTINSNICVTSECQKIAKEFLNSMNKSIDPCQDFYEFTCGGWTTKNPIPPNLPAWSRFMIFQNTVDSRIRDILETKIDPTEILPVRQAKKWYRSCMDLETLERRGLKPIESITMQAGGWPISIDKDEWDTEEYIWQKVDRYYSHLTGSHAFYQIQIIPSRNEKLPFGSLQISAPVIPLSGLLRLRYKNYNGNDYDAYIHLIEKVANLFVQHNRADVTNETLRKEAEDIVQFEKKIYELSKENEDWVSMTFEEFIDWYETNRTDENADFQSKIDWKSEIQDLFDMVNIKVEPSTKISSIEFEYMKGIDELLNKTPSRTIVNYIHWNFVANMLQYTTEEMRDVLFAFESDEYGITKQNPRWSQCVNEMKMSHAAAYKFVNKYFTKSTESHVEAMVKNIKIEMEKKIENSNWLDETSKIWAKDKLNSMKFFLGFPEWYNNKTAVINFYKGLTIGNEYFDNTLSYMRYVNKQKLKTFTRPMKSAQNDWLIPPTTVNAYYLMAENIVTIPASNFQAPLFTPKLPDYVNYGIAGVVVAHEISHGFDDNGVEFDKDGNETTLSETMLKSYFQKAECFLDQFGKFYGENNSSESTEVESKIKNPNRRKMSVITRPENIADTTGVQAVFQAYKMLNKSENDLKLPGFEDFTSDQLFFLSFAAMWCKVETPKFLAKELEMGDAHSTSRLRVIGAASNTEDFAKAFNCPIGSSMNPKNKCDIWGKPEIAKTFTSASMQKNHRDWLNRMKKQKYGMS